MTDTAPKESGVREIIRFYLVDCRTPLGKAIDIVIVLLNLAVCLMFVLTTYHLSDHDAALLWKMEEGVTALFIIEYAARMYAAKNRLRHFFEIYSIIDLVAILPTVLLLALPFFGLSPQVQFIKTIRAFRVFRIFRFLRFMADEEFFFGRIPVSLLKLFRLILTILIIFFVSSGFFYQMESPVNSHVDNFGDAFYFTVVTLTTVGFGDITPQSEAGRWVTVLMILSGIIFVPWQAGQVAREWLRWSQKSDVTCPNCGLKYHDRDASHCKSCGHVIYQEYDGG